MQKIRSILGRSILGCAALGLAMLAVPARAEVIAESDSAFVTRDSAVVAASPYDTWQALIAPGKWWNNAHTWSADAANMYISAQGGGCFCELLPERENAPDSIRRGSVQHMVVLLADPPRALRMRGGLGPLQSEPVDGVLTITLQPQGDGTKIVWEYVVGGFMRFDTPTIAKAVDGVMSQQLGGLAKLLGRVDDPAEADKRAADAATDETADAAADEEPDPADEMETAGDTAMAEPMIEADDVGAAIDEMGKGEGEPRR